MWRWIAWATAAMGVVIAALLVRGLVLAGAFKTIVPHGEEGCVPVEGFVGGTEDLVWRPGGKELIVSSANYFDRDHKSGALYLVDTEAASPVPVDVTPSLAFPLYPHGIDLWVGDDGAERLFVVNHRAAAAEGRTGKGPDQAIEIFDVAADGTLTYVESITDPALHSPNDVAAAGPRSFYASNDHSWDAPLARVLEDYLMLPIGDVVYFDGRAARSVYGGTQYANGVVRSADGRYLYLAETTGRRVSRLAIGAGGALELNATIDLGTGVDNISGAADGRLWIGAHPKLFAFKAHAADRRKRSPSQVLTLRFGGPGETGHEVEEPYLSDGGALSGSSVAASNGRRFAIGAVFEHRLLLCPDTTRG